MTHKNSPDSKKPDRKKRVPIKDLSVHDQELSDGQSKEIKGGLQDINVKKSRDSTTGPQLN